LRGAGEADPAEEAGILKDEGAVRRVENQMVVFAGDMMRGFRGKFSRHAEVDSQPNLRAKAEQHLFAVGLAGNHSSPRQPAKEFLGGGAAEHPLAGMKMDAEDLFSPPGKPAAAEIKDLGEFRHNPKLRADREKSKLGRGKGFDILSRWRQS
jgi:hypothetical protein